MTSVTFIYAVPINTIWLKQVSLNAQLRCESRTILDTPGTIEGAPTTVRRMIGNQVWAVSLRRHGFRST